MSIMQKLRAVAIAAHSKIHRNAHKKVPGKWPEIGFNELSGKRDWMRCPGHFLDEKLGEECIELTEAANACSRAHSLNDDSTPAKEKHRQAAEACLFEAGDVAALAMMIADHAGALMVEKSLPPKVVCLCGSTKFKDMFMAANKAETLKGNIVLSVGAFMHADAVPITETQKEMLDDLHKRKIDLSDEILVLNVGGYIGSSTRSEIQYAKDTGKLVRYLEFPND